MIKLNIHGSVFGNSGYDYHTNGLFNALSKIKDLDIKLHTPLPQNWTSLCTDNILDAITKPERKEDWNLIITIPQLWKLFLGQGKNACYCVWEGDKVPVSWIDDMLNPKVDVIIVPSKHTAQAIWNTIGDYLSTLHYIDNVCVSTVIANKLTIISHGVDREIFHNENKPKQDDIFRFVCNKGWRGTSWDRGGVQYLIKAFAEEFRKDEKVELIVKLNPVYINPETISMSLQSLNLPDDRATIKVNCDILPFNILKDLYNTADCFVCATRAESFNLPGLEAMACGLPTIQTLFGGQTDYMNEKNSLFIDYELNDSEEKPFYEGIKWALPRMNTIRKQLRWALNNKDRMKEMGKQAEEDSKRFTWDITASTIAKFLC